MPNPEETAGASSRAARIRGHMSGTNRGEEPASIDEVNVMSAKNANNNAENAKNGKAAKSMTEHYTLGHKAVAVAMSTVMLGFGVPVNAPKDAYADSDATAEQPADSDAAAKKSTEDATSKKAESASTDSSAASSSASSESKSQASNVGSSSAKEAAKAEQKTTADVALSLGNASIKYQGQTIAAPTTKVTVPTKNAFKFTVAPDNGYALTKVTVKVSGKESTLTADANGVYTVSAADVLTGASVKLVTEKQVQAQPAASTTPIQDTEADSSAAQQPATSDNGAADNEQQSSDESGNVNGQENAGDNASEFSDQQSGEGASGEDAPDADGSDSQVESSDASQLQTLGNQLVSMLSDSGSAISGPTSVAQADTITLTYNGEGTPQFWNGGDGLFSSWTESADHRTLTLTATSNWAFNGSSKNTTIYCAYVDANGVWHTAGQGAEEFTVTVTKRSFAMVQPDAVAEGEDHFWIPSIVDNATGKVINLADAPSGSFYPFEYYRDGVKIENASQYYHDANEFKKPGKYTVVIKPNSGWIYDFQGEVTVVVPTVGEAEFSTNDPVDCIYDGNEHKWAPTVTDSDTGAVLTEGTDYELSYDTTDFTNPGTITVTITGKGNYKSSSATKTYRIIKVSIIGKDSIKEGDKTTYKPDGFTSDVTWSSSDSSILEIDPVTGEATGVYPGTVTIWAVDKEGHVASKDVTVTRDEKNGCWVYVYTQVKYNGLNLSQSAAGRAKAKELGLTVNGHGWFTLGKVWVSGIKAPGGNGLRNTEYQQKTIANLSKVERYNANGNINFDDIEWNGYVSSTSGADNYVSAGWTWHLDGMVDIQSMTKVNVHYVEKGTNKELGSDQITTTVGKEFDPASQKRDFEGYTFDSADAAFVPEEGQVKDVYLYYTKGTFPYTVKYVDKDTGEELHASATHGGEYGAEVTEDALDIKGYEVDEAQKTMKIGTGSNTITFYYTKKAIDYTVNYYVNGTTEKVADSKTISGAKYGDTVTAEQQPGSFYDYEPGYTLVPNQNPTITLSEDTHEINVYYYKNVELTANSGTETYDGTEKSVSGIEEDKVPSDADFSNISVGATGANVGTYPATFPKGTVGTVDGTGKYIVTEANDGQLIINPVTDEVTVKIKGNSDSQKYDGKEHSVSGYSVVSISNNALKDADIVLSANAAASASGTDAGTYNMGLNAGSFALNEGVASNFTNVKFEVEDGQLEITKRKITLWSEDGHKNYDGAALQRRTDILVDGVKDVYNNDTDTTTGKVFQGDGFAEGEGIEGKTKTNWFNQNGQSDTTNIAPGVYENRFTVTFKEGTNPENYDITYEYGKLYVNKRADKDLYTITVAANSDAVTYDGKEHSVSGVTLTAGNKKYSTSGMTFTNEKGIVFTISGYSAEAKGTDAGEYTSKVVANNVKVTDPAGNDVTDQFKFSTSDGKLTVNKKDAKITAADAEKEYDGTALTTDQFITDGFVEGQGIASATVEGSQTLVGSSESSIKENSWKAKEGTNLNNYNISTAKGTLTVKNREAQYQVELQAKGGTKTYNGYEQSVSGLVSNTFTQNGETYTVSGLTVGASGTDAGSYQTTAAGVAKVLDSKGNDVSGQFAVTVKPAQLVIEQKSVTLKSKNLSKEYDGIALTNGENELETEEGWAEGQGATYTFDGARTEVGTTTGGNTFTVKANDGTNLNNYKISQTAGDLTVTKNTSAIVVTITGKTLSEKYDGTAKRVEGYDVDSSNALYTSADFTFSGAGVLEGTDAGTYAMGLKASDFTNTSKNFENVTFNVVSDSKLEIAKRKVALTSATPESKVYDGTPLFDHTVTAGGEDGFAEGDSFTAEVTGSQTDAGTSNNAFTYELAGNGAKKDAEGNYVNYDVAKTEGSLTVAPVADEVVVTIKGHKGGQEYNGLEQTIEGYDVESSSDLYKADDFAFSGTALVKGTDAKDGGYAMGLGVDQFKNTNGNFAKVTFKVEDGQLNIAQRNVTLVSQGHTWKYTGETFALPDVTIGGSGFVEGEASDVKATGSVQNVNDEQTNTITWTRGANYKASNYNIKKTEGVLRVIAGNNIADYVTLTPTDVAATYDGKDHAAGTATAKDKNGGKLTIEYSADGNNWTTNPAEITAKNVNDSRNGEAEKNAKVQVRVSSPNYTGYVEDEESITITKRVVSLSSDTASKPYDGTPLTRTEVAGWQQSGDTGFVTGEVSDVKATGSVTDVAEGEVVNTIVYTEGNGFSESNYDISKDEGKLSITPGTGIKNKVTLRTSSLGHIYDGAAYELPASYAETNDKSPLVIEYSADNGATWTTDPSSVKAVNVSDSKNVKVRVSSTNFSDVVEGTASLTISKREVLLLSESAKMVYDGTALTRPTVTYGGVGDLNLKNGFVEGEVKNLRATGSRTEVGSTTNTIEYETAGNFRNENYNISEKLGTLTVTGQSIVPDPENPDTYKGITISDPSDSVYDGLEHKWTPEVKDASGNTLKEGTDYTVSYDTGNFVDAKTIKVTITGAGNYVGTATKTYKITPAPLAVTTPSASKVYDGTALEANTGTAENISGLIGSETATVKAKGSQTDVGTSGNTYDGIEWGTAKESNYAITSVNEGMLNVTPKSIADKEHGMTVGELKDVTYNGSSQQQKPEVKDGDKVLEEGKDYELSYSEDTTNAGTVTVTVTGKGNYAGSVDRSYQILPAELTVETASANKVYDGTPLTAEGITVNGLVNNETVNFTTTGSQTSVGEGSNTYAQNWTGTAKQSNYTITEEKLGKLSVTESADQISVTVTGGEWTYDGQPHGATVKVDGLPAGYRVAEASSDTVATDATDPTEVNGVIANIDNLVIVNAEGQDVTSSLNIKKGEPAYIKVNPATLTVTTPSASMPYDGTALTAEGSISGFVNNEDATFTTTGSQTLVGKSKNTYEIAWNGTAKQGNYTIDDDRLGELEVTQNQAAIMVVPQGGTKVYDGTALTSAGVTTYGLPAGYTLEAITGGMQVDAGNSLATVASYKIFDAAGNEVTSQFGNVSTGFANLTVTKRPVTLTSQGGTWTYDGNAHKNETVAASAGENEGFVNGEGFDYSNFASITAVGTVANTFEYKAKAGTKADNYDVKVATQNLVVEAKSIDPEVEASMSVDSPSDVVYDGQEHKWAPVVKDGSKTLVEGTDYTVSYPEGQDFTNVKGAITATIAGIGNYSGSVTRSYQITPASVKLASNSHEYTYNGEYQSDETVKVSGAEALFKSQVEGLKATGKVKYVSEGKVPNTIAYTWKEGFSADNYIIETSTGELSVKEKNITPSEETGMAINDPSDSVYDGKEHKWAPIVKDGDKVLVEGTDYTVSYPEGQDFTNVTGAITATIRGIGNYSGTVQKSYQITKREVTLVSGSDSKTYDGEPLTNSDVFATSYYDFVSGDATYSATGSITMPDSVKNDIDIKWANDSVANNYNVTLKPGTLTVVAKSITAKDMTVGTLPDVTYNGLEQIQKPEVKDGNKTLNEGADYELSFSKDATNAGTVTVTVTGKGGYTGSTQVTYRINPAPLTVNTPSDTKAYDGTPLAKAGSITGFVNNETATFATTGSQTTVGSSANTYSIDWNGTAKQSNYQINESVGTLTVTESTNEVVVTTTGETVTYDGQPHGATVTVANLPVGYTAQATSNASATDANGEGIAATVDNLVIYNTNGEDVTAQLNIKRVDGTIKVLPRQLNVTTPDASKVYDGEALTAEGSISGFVPGETAAFATTGSQTEVGDSQNTYSLDWTDNAKASNYTVNEQLGTLSVSRQTINPDDPENPKAYDGVQISYPQDVTYDGREHKWAPTVTNKQGAELVEGTDYTVAYDKSNFTDVTGDILVTITGIGNYSGSVTRTYKINPAAYYVVTDGASKTYDGSELKAPGRVVGLVNGEEVAFETTGSQTEVGSSANGYDLKFSKSAKEGNYTHVTDSIGLLTVNAAKAEGAITLEGAPASKTYDGTSLEAGVAKASVPTGDNVTIEYSTDGQNWTTDPSTITATDVDDSTTVQLRASSLKNYTGYVYGSEELTINKRQVNLESETASKTFDGTALTKPEVSGWQQQGDEGFVSGEVDNVRATGSVTYVSEGTVSNSIAYDTKGGFKDGNYTIVKTEGTLAITGQSINPGDKDSYLGIQISDPSDVEYDGTEHVWAPVVTDQNGNVLVEGRDYTVTYPAGQDFTNVTGAITATIAGIGNYAGTVQKSYQITPKELTVNTDSATKVYDGTPLTAGGSIAGLVGEETATVVTPNSQTEVGSAFNFATSIEWGTAQERNYTWKIGEIGTLTVTAQSIVPDPENPESYKGITIDDPSDSVYDGQEHKWAPTVKDAAGNVLVEGRDYTVTYPAGQDFTNVTGAIVATIAGIGNYAGTVQKSYQITPAQLAIATGSSQKQYDGTPLTNSQLEINGLVGGDAVAARTTGSQTEVGSSANTYEITWGMVRSANYTIASEELGTLTVTEAPATPATPGDNGTTATPGSSQGGGNPVLNNVARVLEGNFNAVTGSNDNAAAIAAGEQIYDEENPLGTTYEDACWVHYYIILGMILSGIYGLGVMFRRLNHIRKLRNDMNDVMGDGDGKDPERVSAPSSKPAGMEA